MLSSVALVQVLFPALFVFLQLLDIPPVMSQRVVYKISVTLQYFIISLIFKSSVTIRVQNSSLFYKGLHNCSSGSMFWIILGTKQWNPVPPPNPLISTTAIIHSKYNIPSTLNNDIALITLPTPVNFTSEYCHILTNVKITLFVLEQMKCFLFEAEN